MKQEYVHPDLFADIIKKQEVELANTEKVHEKGAHKGKVRGEYIKKEKNIEKNKELLFVYRQYEALLSQERLYDFEDMIIETVRALEADESFLRTLQETYQYVLADEHQDVNGSQNRILELLCAYHDQPNIFVVGDEKQAIYRFQGASLENFLYFEEVFAKTKTIALTDNYRSGQTILDASHSLVEVEEGPLHDLRVPLIAKAKSTSSVERRSFSHQAVEDTWVVSLIAKEIEEGTPPEEIAVILRTNKEVEQLASLVQKSDIEVAPSADGDILKQPLIHTIRSLIEVVGSPAKQDALFMVLHGAYWGISSADFVKVAAHTNYQRKLSEIIKDENLLQEAGVENIETFLKISSLFHEARKRQLLEPPQRVLEYLLHESGFLDYVLAHDPIMGGKHSASTV